MLYFKHAWHRTFNSFGGSGFIWTLLAIPAVGLLLHYLVSGEDAMSAELEIWLIYGLASAGLVFSTVFLWNLACAPYRIERANHEKTKLSLAPYLDQSKGSERLRFELGKRDRLTLSEVVNLCMPDASDESMAKQMLLETLKAEVFEGEIESTGGNYQQNIVAKMGRESSALSSTKKISKSDAKAFAKRQGYSLG